MSNISIGVTATELFAYNPFRILGIPVNASGEDIEHAYSKMQKLSESGSLSDYKTPYDFDSLPPFTRTAQSIKAAHTKLASTGYRCFAYADSEFSESLNIDDILLNLRDISCYDCFLRCYMWLVINDRELNERDLWILLAGYIDKMIDSSPDEWAKYFDDRFPSDMVNSDPAVLKSFHDTFSQIILLPLKEMVRGSMKCRTATEILIAASIDINEQFEYIDIPQANIPEAGQPQPKLKLALKYGDEYFDISTGTMKSYSTDTEAAESNSFAESANAPLDAGAIVDEPVEDEVQAEEELEEPTEQSVSEPTEQAQELEPQIEREAVEPQPQTTFKPAPFETPKPVEAPKPERKLKSRAELKAEREAAERAAAESQQEVQLQPAPAPVEQTPVQTAPAYTTPAPQATVPSQTAPQTAPVPQSAPTEAPKPRRSFRSQMAQQGEAVQTSPAKPAADFSTSNPFLSMNAPKPAENNVQKTHRSMEFTKVVEEAAKKEIITFDEETESAFTDAMIEMLKSNQTRTETMKSVDTRHRNDNLAGPSRTSAQMDDINMEKFDEKLLASSREGLVNRKLTREEKYRNVKIDDMLSTNTNGKNYGSSAIDEYKKRKEKEKANRRSLWITTGVLALCLIIFAVMWYFGIF
ncbi:MAG: hypothetical protein LUE12_09415 [Ruminococcus sp.]|nr:hypothetical protein [Ruminococcus sp.]